VYQYLSQVLAEPTIIFRNPGVLLLLLFSGWMFIDACRRGEWVWALCVFVFPVLSPILYYFYVYRQSQPLNGPTFELPGAGRRRRIKELQDQIHHLDKAHHHSQLADIYFAQGKLKEAEKEYVAAIERDGEDLETLAHYGQCLLRLGRAREARPLLEKVINQNSDHEYGATMMMYGETLGALGEKDAAITAWKKVLERHSYAQAKVNLAKLLIEKGDKETAQHDLHEVIADAGHGPAFHRKREKAWAKEAASLLKSIK
jgi:hypothetical protein